MPRKESSKESTRKSPRGRKGKEPKDRSADVSALEMSRSGLQEDGSSSMESIQLQNSIAREAGTLTRGKKAFLQSLFEASVDHNHVESKEDETETSQGVITQPRKCRKSNKNLASVDIQAEKKKGETRRTTRSMTNEEQPSRVTRSSVRNRQQQSNQKSSSGPTSAKAKTPQPKRWKKNPKKAKKNDKKTKKTATQAKDTGNSEESMETKKTVSQAKDTGNSEESKETKKTASQAKDTGNSEENKETKKTASQAKDTGNSEDSDETDTKTKTEVWDMVRRAKPKDEKRPCSSKCCNRLVVAVWATNLNPDDEWFTCEVCLIRDFRGWPKRRMPKCITDDSWTLVRRAISILDEIKACSNCGCKYEVVAVWATKLHPNDEWFTCKECKLGPLPLVEEVETTGKQSSKKCKSSSSRKRPCEKSNTTSSTRQPGNKKKKSKSTNIDNPTTIAGSRTSNTSTNPGHVLHAGTQDGHASQMNRPPPVTPSPFAARFPLPTLPGYVSKDLSIRVAEHQIGKSTTSESPRCVTDLAMEMPGAIPMRMPDDRVLVTIKHRKLSDGNAARSRHSWTSSEVLLSVPSNCTSEQPSYIYKLRRGGTLKVIPNMFGPERLARIEKEVMNCGLFRQYRLQGQDEPRVHFLLHEDATDNFEEKQPGYSYANLCVKSRPLRKLPDLQVLSKEVAMRTSNVTKWNIGVNPVLYLGNRDSMGEHSDDDQGEEVILCLIVSSPKRPRRIRIVPKARGEKAENGDECIELMLSEGDAYVMDKEMQEHYFHSVPKRKDDTVEKEDSVRLCIVFRTGDDLQQLQDSGRPCEDLFRKEGPEQIFGNGIMGLFEGDVYTREQLFQMGAHRMQQRGISGKIETGADALIVSGLREDQLGCDRFHQLVYAVEQRKGGKAVLTSWEKQLPIRVFRSSHYQSPYKAISMNPRKTSSTIYRYDGLYKVVNRREPVAQGRPFIFQFQRLDAGKEDDESDPYSNRCSNEDVLTKYIEMGTIQIQQNTSEVNQNLIDEVHDSFGVLHAELGRIDEGNPPVPNAHIMQQVQDLCISQHLENLAKAHRRKHLDDLPLPSMISPERNEGANRLPCDDLHEVMQL